MLKKNIANSPEATRNMAMFAAVSERTRKIESRTSGAFERSSITTNGDEQHRREREQAERARGRPAVLRPATIA